VVFAAGAVLWQRVKIMFQPKDDFYFYVSSADCKAES